MPVSTSAKKALRRDVRRTHNNQFYRSRLKTTIDNARSKPTPENLQLAYSVIDKAAKKGIIHDNKAARLKSQLSHTKTTLPKPTKTPAKKVRRSKTTKPKAKTTR